MSRLLCLASLAALTAAPASAQEMYQRLTPEDLRDIFLLNGLPAELQAIDGGDVVSDSRVAVADPIQWVVYLYNCDEAGCGDIQFRTAFDDAAPELDALNAWNRSNRFTRAYRAANGAAVLELDLNVRGGVTINHVSQMLPVWRASIVRFNDALLAREQAAETGPDASEG